MELEEKGAVKTNLFNLLADLDCHLVKVYESSDVLGGKVRMKAHDKARCYICLL